jgi:ribonuclease BN (tRNA processing enzyme)
VEVTADDGATIVLDAGSGIVHVGPLGTGPVHVLLTHLHMDHIQGLGFFRPLFDPTVEVHLWGPVSVRSLADRLSRYLSPPLFPVRLRDLPEVVVHDFAPGSVDIGPFRIDADFVIHPGQTYGYRITADGRTLTYLPDHEPALGRGSVPEDPRWTSGFDLARGADLLLHDAQYAGDEYAYRAGWGHSTIDQAVDFAELAEVGRLVTFHHEPDHSDEQIDRLHDEIRERRALAVSLDPGLVGVAFDV